MWLTLIVLSVAALVPITANQVLRTFLNRRGLVAAIVVVSAIAQSVIWTRTQGALEVGVEKTELKVIERLSETASQLAVWVFQSIAAFPLRNEPTHPSVYAVFMILGLFLVSLAFAAGSPRERMTIAIVIALSLLVPAVITFQTVERYGTAWQGRYSLPYSMGIALVSAFVLSRKHVAINPVVTGVGMVMYAIAHTVGPIRVAESQLASSPGVTDGTWVLLPAWVLTTFGVCGAVMAWIGATWTRGVALEHTAVRSDRDGANR